MQTISRKRSTKTSTTIDEMNLKFSVIRLIEHDFLENSDHFKLLNDFYRYSFANLLLEE